MESDIDYKQIPEKGQNMNFKEFLSKTESSMKAFFGPQAQIEIKEIRKNNGVMLNGLIITEEKETISPTIYMDGFYLDYQKGKSFGRIVEEIINLYRENKVKVPINMDFFLDYESVRGRIFQKVINYERNKELLENVPHIKYMDLAVVTYYAYMNDFLGRGSIQITISHLDKWGIDEEILFEDAIRNTREKLGVEILGMKDMLIELFADNTENMDINQVREATSYVERDVSMHVMTLKGRYFGAACIYDTEMLKKFGEKCRRNFFILPSSIHELILIPDTGLESAESLRRMVREVNAEHVDEEEQLSDNVYYFNLSSNTVKIV